MHVCTHTHTHIYIYMKTHKCTHACGRVHTHTHMHTHTHTHRFLWCFSLTVLQAGLRHNYTTQTSEDFILSTPIPTSCRCSHCGFVSGSRHVPLRPWRFPPYLPQPLPCALTVVLFLGPGMYHLDLGGFHPIYPNLFHVLSLWFCFWVQACTI